MAGPLAKYAFINAKLRARISKILPDDTFAQLAKAPSLEATLALLREGPFAGLEPIYDSTGDLKLAELELLKGEIALYRDVRQHLHASTQPLVEALLSRFEIENLKNAIRLFFDRTVRKRSVEAGIHYVLFDRIVHSLPIDVIINARSLEEIAGICSGTPYERIISKYSAVVESEGSLFRLEMAFDHYYYERLMEAIGQLDRRDRDVAMRLVGVEIDLQNIDWIIRFRKFYELPLEAVLAAMVPGGFSLNKTTIEELYRAQNVTTVLQGFVEGKYPGLSSLLASPAADSTSRLMLIQRILDEIRRREIQHILAGYPFTVGVILAYFILKGEELKKVRLILNAKEAGRSLERIESML
jgi:V/A-type H+/Na+-transporting ATPase subunit C